MEATEIRQRGVVFHQVGHAPIKRQPFHPAGIVQKIVERLGDLDQHFDQIGDRRARGADVGHEQHGIARGLVDLDAVFIHQDLRLEGIAIPTGAAHGQGNAGGVKDELILLPTIPHISPALLHVIIAGDAAFAVLFGDHVAGGKHFEILP